MKTIIKKLMVIIFIVLIIAYVIVTISLKKEEKETINEVNSTNNENIENEILEELEKEEEYVGIEGKYEHDEYQQKINDISKKYGAVGVSVALFENGKVIDTFTYGDAIKGKLPMTDETKIRIASLSKIFVGLATMISVENGTMSLDEDIGTYWGIDVKTKASGDVITPRSILTHTSSIIATDNVSATYYNSMMQRLKSGTGIRNIVSGSIKNYSYNNYAIDVLGITVELANNKRLDDILGEYLYEKLGVDAAFYAGDLKDKSNVATIYRSDGSVGRTSASITSHNSEEPGAKGFGFAGGVTISVKDLGKIIALIANNGVYEDTRYLSEDIIANLEYHENNEMEDKWQCQPLFYKPNMYNQEDSLQA